MGSTKHMYTYLTRLEINDCPTFLFFLFLLIFILTPPPSVQVMRLVV